MNKRELKALKQTVWDRLFTDTEYEQYEEDHPPSKLLLEPMPVIWDLPGNHAAIRLSYGRILSHEEADELITAIQNFYDRVTPADIAVLNMRPDNDEGAPVHKPRPTPGYVYLFETNGGNPHKIGMTVRNPEQRLRALQTQSPHPANLAIRATCYVSNPAAYEAELHERYASKRLHGEWFDLTDDDIVDLEREFHNIAEKFNE